MRLFFVILLIFIIVSFLKLIYKISKFLLILRRHGLKDFSTTFKANTAHAIHQPKNNAKIIKCVTCQIYVPATTAYYANGKVYCCQAHAK